MKRLFQMEIKPAFVVALVLIVGAVMAYAFWYRPVADEAKILREWNTPEAAAKRGPGRQVSPEYQAKLDELLAKERAHRPTRRDRE